MENKEILKIVENESEILSNFLSLGYSIIRNDDEWFDVEDNYTNNSIMVCKSDQTFSVCGKEPFSIWDLKLLFDLFVCWGWYK